MPFTVFFSCELAPPKEERVASKEKNAATLLFVRFFSDKLAPPNENQVLLEGGKATSLPFVGIFIGKLALPKEKTTLPPPAAPLSKRSGTFSLFRTGPKAGECQDGSDKGGPRKG